MISAKCDCDYVSELVPSLSTKIISFNLPAGNLKRKIINQEVLPKKNKINKCWLGLVKSKR